MPFCRSLGQYALFAPPGSAPDAVQRLLDAVDGMHLQAGDGLFGRVGLGHDGHVKAQLGRFAQALLTACGWPHLASQAGSVTS